MIKILNTAATAFELYLLTSVGIILKRALPEVQIDLLLDERLAKELHITDTIKKFYNKIFYVNFPGPISSRRKIFNNIHEAWKFRKYLKKFDFHYQYFFINSYNEFFSNMLYRHLPQSTNIIIVTVYSKPQIVPDFKFKMIYRQFQLYDFLFGYSPSSYKWSPITKRLSDKKILRYPKHIKILISDHEVNDKNLKNFEHILPPPFMILKTLYPNYDTTPSILFAGERTPLYPTWTDKDEKVYENIFQYLREHFKEYQLYFKPRLGFTNMDMVKKYLKNFIMIDPREPLEELLAKKYFHKVISIKSTVSRLGAYFQMPSYVLYPMFNMPKNLKLGMADNIFQELHTVIQCTSLDDLNKIPKIIDNVEKLTQKYLSAIQSTRKVCPVVEIR